MTYLRPAAAADEQSLFDWRNHPTTRAASGGSEPIGYADHCRWFARFLADPARAMWLGVAGQRPVGSVRLDPLDETGTYLVSIQIAPDQRGQGHGQQILALACHKAPIDLRACRLVAHIRAENKASAHIFKKAGFVRQIGQTPSGLDIWHFDFPAPRAG